jgi:hypothetical protein
VRTHLAPMSLSLSALVSPVKAPFPPVQESCTHPRHQHDQRLHQHQDLAPNDSVPNHAQSPPTVKRQSPRELSETLGHMLVVDRISFFDLFILSFMFTCAETPISGRMVSSVCCR